MKPEDDIATLTDEDIETRRVDGAPRMATQDSTDTADDSGDPTDAADTGDDSGDASDATDTGDDAGDSADPAGGSAAGRV